MTQLVPNALTLTAGAAVAAVITAFVLASLRKDAKWGINLGRPTCGHCGEPQPMIRKPLNERQALWGGYTCRKCGTELDKWGRPIADDAG